MLRAALMTVVVFVAGRAGKRWLVDNPASDHKKYSRRRQGHDDPDSHPAAGAFCREEWVVAVFHAAVAAAHIAAFARQGARYRDSLSLRPALISKSPNPWSVTSSIAGRLQRTSHPVRSQGVPVQYFGSRVCFRSTAAKSPGVTGALK